MKKLISAVLLLNVFILLGCGGGDSSSDKSAKRYSRPPKRILSEAEKIKFITPTIYYVSDYSNTANQCGDDVEIKLRKGKDSIVTMHLCRRVYKGCKMQGSCYIKIDGQKTMINYHKKLASGMTQFMLVDISLCKYGMGDSSDSKQSFKAMCLDPFYSVAADTAIYPLGTVIHIPAVQGTVLPDGSTHDGHFVVRDSGGNIDGRGRFDFFTGDLGLNASNPFSALGLGGEVNFDYKVVSDGEAQAVRKRRKFPLLN